MDRERVKALYQLVTQIPKGKVMSYSGLGRLVGLTARQSGSAMKNAPPNIPWHRVVGADGSLRIFAYSPEAGAEQLKRLQKENVPFRSELRVDMRIAEQDV
jgi:methylated-DNA-protein-cysteine methyltransferase-like protein